MNILVLDTETTGLARFNSPLSDPAQPNLVQLSALQVRAEPLRVLQSLSLIVLPDMWTVPAEAEAVHGISTEMAQFFGQPEKEVLTAFLKLWEKSDLLVAHNVKFDKHIIACSMARAYPDTTELLHEWINFPSLCTMEECKPVVQARNVKGALKWPKLSEAYRFFFNEDFDNQHSANADAVACMQIYFALLQHKADSHE